MQKQRGFTLIELLVVIAIIGILSSVVLASLSAARAKARDSKRQQQLISLRTALELYHVDNNAYPFVNNWTGYQTVGCGITGTLTGASGYIPNLAPTYISVLPTDPNSTTGCWDGIIYDSDGVNYKLLDYILPETIPAAGAPFYDSHRAGTNTFMLCSGEPACSSW